MSDTLYKTRIEVDTSRAQQAAEQLASKVTEVKKSTERLRDEHGRFTKKGTEAYEAAKHKAEELGKEIDETTSKTTTATNETEKFGSTGANAAQRFGAALRTIELTSIIQQVQMVTSALGDLAKPSMTFEQSMADLSAITGSVGEELEDLTKTARKVGMESGLGAAESARAFAILAGQIDVPIAQLKELQRETITLAQAGALPLEDAANAVAGTINQFGYEASEASRVVNVLAAGSRAGGAEVVDLAESFKVVGAAAHSAGVSLEETAAAIEILAQNNTKGAEAGTAMRNMLIAMQTRLGIDVSKTGFAGGLDIIRQKLRTMGSETAKTTFLAKAFGRENIVAAQYLLENADAVRAMTTEVTGTNSALEQAEIRNETWAHKMEVARARMDEMLISLGNVTGSILPMGAIVGEQVAKFAMLTPLVVQAGNAIRGLGLKTIIATTIQHGFNVALSANPIGAVILAVTALVAAVVYAYKHIDSFRQEINDLWASIKKLWDSLKGDLMPVLETVGKVIKGAVMIYVQLLAKHVQILARMWRWVIDAIRSVIDWFNNLSPAVKSVISVLNHILNPIQHIIDSLELLGSVMDAVLGSPPTDGVKNMTDQVQAYTRSLDDNTRAQVANYMAQAKGKSVMAMIAGNKELAREIATRAKGMNIFDLARNGGSVLSGALSALGYKGKEQEEITTADTTAHNITLKSKKGEQGDKAKIYNLSTIEGLQNNIQKLQEQLNKSTTAEAVELQKVIDKYEEMLDLLKRTIEIQAKEALPLVRVGWGETLNAKGEVTQRRDALGRTASESKQANSKDLKSLIGKAAAEAPKTLYASYKKYLEMIRGLWDKTVDNMQRPFDRVARLANNVGAIMQNLGERTENSMLQAAGAWLQWGANVASTIAEALPHLLALFKANMSVSASETTKSQAGIPVVGPMLALASVASIIAALTNIPTPTAFAQGGIVSGPTYALVGEYAGASNNPEVIAPLSKLRDYINPASNTPQGGEVAFRIEGRTLVGLLQKEGKYRSLS